MKNIHTAHTAASSPEGCEWNSLYCIQWKQETEDKEENQSLKYLERWANRDEWRSHLHKKHVIPLPSTAFIPSSADSCSFATHLSLQVIDIIVFVVKAFRVETW